MTCCLKPQQHRGFYHTSLFRLKTLQKPCEHREDQMESPPLLNYASLLYIHRPGGLRIVEHIDTTIRYEHLNSLSKDVILTKFQQDMTLQINKLLHKIYVTQMRNAFTQWKHFLPHVNGWLSPRQYMKINKIRCHHRQINKRLEKSGLILLSYLSSQNEYRRVARRFMTWKQHVMDRHIQIKRVFNAWSARASRQVMNRMHALRFLFMTRRFAQFLVQDWTLTGFLQFKRKVELCRNIERARLLLRLWRLTTRACKRGRIAKAKKMLQMLRQDTKVCSTVCPYHISMLVAINTFNVTLT